VSSYFAAGAQPSFQLVLRSFAQGEGLPFASALSEDEINALAKEEGVAFGQGDDCVYTPPTTLWAWLSQCFSDSKSCVAAVARLIVLRVSLDLAPCSAETGAYCAARQKLPEPFLKRLALHVGSKTEDQALDSWRWHKRRVLLVDGAECSMPDTPENQKEYPQHGAQKAGLGFPMIRLVVLLAFATAALVGGALGPCKGKETGETALLREMLSEVRAQDVVVADRCYCSYWMIALLLARGADVAFRLHQRRKVDYQKATRLGPDDHLTTWERPERPEWMTEEEYAEIPLTLTIRMVRVHVSQAGYRTRVIDVATTILDDKAYAKEDIAELYHKRWHVELDIRVIKQTLNMDILTCKTPEMIRREIWVHLLAYNLVRQVMAQTARDRGVSPRQVSFAGAAQTVCAFRWMLIHETERRPWLLRVLWLAVSTHQVGNRPGRYEPRQVKRRKGGKYDTLKEPRAQARAALRDAAES
jgi:hypothetical protein